VESEASEVSEALAYDPQTAGGLLVSMPDERVPVLEATLAAEGILAARIGRVEAGAGVLFR
jgi:selenide, water dikinase